MNLIETNLTTIAGGKPVNSHFFPTEQWWMTHEKPYRQIHGDWYIQIVALSDGTFSIENGVWNIKHNSRGRVNRGMPNHVPCVYPDRTAAIRAAAARRIRQAKSLASSPLAKQFGCAITCEERNQIIKWFSRLVDRETGRKEGRDYKPYTPPPPPPPTGLEGTELFSLIQQRPCH